MLLNKTVKLFGYIGVHILLILGMYLTSLVFTAPIICITEAIYNIFSTSHWFGSDFYITYLVGSIPMTLVLVTIVELRIIEQYIDWKVKHNK